MCRGKLLEDDTSNSGGWGHGDVDLAARLAEEAGAALLALRQRLRTGGELGLAADRLANSIIMKALETERPEDGLLSEEAPDSLVRLQRRRTWIVDPLDGTREYAQGRSDWAVHVALAVDGAPTLGAVAVPALRRVFRSDQPVQRPRRDGRLRIVVSRTRPPPFAAALAERLGADLMPLGSAGAKAMAVVSGEADAYVHAGGQNEWDSCAPVAVALGHGLHATRLDGSPLRYNQPDAAVPDLLIARKELGSEIVALLGDPSISARK